MVAYGVRTTAITVLVWTGLAMACSASEIPQAGDATVPTPTVATALDQAPGVFEIPQLAEVEATTVSEHARTDDDPKAAAPPFELALFNGETLTLADLEGKVVVLNFWASWCPPCRFEMPDFETAWNEFRDRDVVFVGVAVSDFEEDARSFARETGITYPIGFDGEGETAVAYGIKTLPTTVFIDREGRVARKLVNRANMGVLKIFLNGLLEGS
jgi:peroxiredoxin